jgi:hypothetical protein
MEKKVEGPFENRKPYAIGFFHLAACRLILTDYSGNKKAAFPPLF